LAAHIVAKNYKKYGFVLGQDPDAQKWEDYDTVSVPSGARLSDIAAATGVSLDVLKQWNADLIRGYTPYSKNGSVDIYVPKTMVNKVEENRLAIERIKRVKVGAPERRAFASVDESDGSYNVYVVHGGDSLYSISHRLNVSVRTLMKINGLRHRKIHPGQRLRYYGEAVSQHSVKSRQLASVKTEKKKHKKHHSQEM
jgi:LysM repeat protein